MRSSVHSASGAAWTAIKALARRGSDRPSIMPGATRACSGWSMIQRSTWISTTSNRRLASRRDPQRVRSDSANSRSSVACKPSMACSGNRITSGSDCTIGLRRPPSKSSVAQVKSAPSMGGLMNSWCTARGNSSNVGSHRWVRASCLPSRYSSSISPRRSTCRKPRPGWASNVCTPHNGPAWNRVASTRNRSSTGLRRSMDVLDELTSISDIKTPNVPVGFLLCPSTGHPAPASRRNPRHVPYSPRYPAGRHR